MPDFEWFRAFGEVPGINWASPVAVSVRPPLTTARPVVEREPDFTFVRWVDEQGQRLPDRFGFGSPASTLGHADLDQETTVAVVTRATNALSLPGTRGDYFQVIESTMFDLWRLDDGDPTRNGWLEHVAWLGVELLRAGIEQAVVPVNAPPERRQDYLKMAARPYSTLVDLYRRDGYLREAASVYAEFEALPIEEHRDQAKNPREAIAALEELAVTELSR
jgi:hypothetical protein